MRTSLVALLTVVAAMALPVPSAFAGRQMYEPMSAAIREQMSRAVADVAPQQLHFEQPEEGYRWLLDMSDRLARRIPDVKWRVELLKTVHYEATRAGLDPQLVLGLIQVESGFKKYAVSSAGARGLMQVMPFWVKVIGEADHNLFDLRRNLRYGCLILRHYIDMEKGDLFRALGRYNGSLGRAEYPNMVLSAWKQWHWQPVYANGVAPSNPAARPVTPAPSPALPARPSVTIARTQ